MSAEFDPYRKWLGIPTKDQPPHHYRLLGIPVFENDPDVIENAADRQMAHLRKFQSGRHSQHSQKLLNEISAAKGCLLQPNKKAAYDDELRAELKKKVSAARAAAPPDAIPASPPPQTHAATGAAVGPDVGMTGTSTGIRRPSAASRVRGRRKKSLMPILLAVGALIGIAVAGAVAMNMMGGTPDNQDSQQSGVNDKSTKPESSDDKDKPENPVVKPSPAVVETPVVKPPTGITPPVAVIPPNPNPGGTETPAMRKQRFDEAIAAARMALEQRNVAEATRQLEIADAAKADSKQSQTVEQTRALRSYIAAFWSAVDRTINKISIGESFEHDGDMFQWISRELPNITYRVNGRSYTGEARKLPSAHAIAFATQTLNVDSAFDKLYIAAFLALDGQGDHSANLAQAKQLWLDAAKTGQKNQWLAVELGLSEMLVADDSPGGFPINNNPLMPAVKKQDVPASLAEARKTVRDLYARDFVLARSNNTAALSLASTLRDVASDESDPALKYVLLTEARDLAAKSADLQRTFAIVDEIAESFNIDPLQVKQTALRDVAAVSDASPYAVFAGAEDLYREALESQHYTVALDVADIAVRAARKAKNLDGIKAVTEQISLVRGYIAEQQQSLAAEQKLVADPEDPLANATVGRYRCFHQGKWQEGLPLLAKGPAGEETDLAKADLASPTVPAKQVALADSWHTFAKKKNGLVLKNTADRARYWYDQAIPFLTGLSRSAAEERLRELIQLSAM